MLLTVPQKYLKELLKEFGALKIRQTKKLIRMKIPDYSYYKTIKPLIAIGDIKEQGEYILDSNGIIDADIITAIDIMLEIESKTIEMIQKGKSPFTLTFFKHREEKLCRYDICTAKQGLEQLLTAELENINAKYRTVVFVLESPEQQDNLFAPCEYCFVWKEEGEYHFYKEVEQ